MPAGAALSEAFSFSPLHSRGGTGITSSKMSILFTFNQPGMLIKYDLIVKDIN